MGWFSAIGHRHSSKTSSRNYRAGRKDKRLNKTSRIGSFESLESRLALSSMPGLVYSDLRVAPAATTGTPSGYSPVQVQAAYGFDNVSFGSVKGDGSGETIAIVDAYNDPHILSDLATFDEQFGLAAPPSIKVVNQTGGITLPTSDTGWSTEIALDVEWAHAIAPGANILLVEANSAYTNDLDAAVDYARNASGVVVVSNSWGGSEYSTESSEDVHFTTPSGHSGVTFTVAAGDDGTGAEYPSSSPNVLSVGGTSLHVTTTSTWSSESVWTGGGGGASHYESVPSYQSGLGLSTRGTPDVSYDADPNTGFAVYDSYGSSGWTEVGGTSAGAPQWAALIAIADQGRALSGLGSLANAQSAIYQVSASDFHDITSGSDGIAPHAGYDLASGRGSPLADHVIADLVAYGATSGTGGTGTTTLAAPQNVTATAASSSSAKLSWSGVSGASGYRILQVSGTQTTVVGTVASTATSATITGLTSGSIYSFKVEAYNGTTTADSALVTVTVPTSSLAPPQNVAIAAVSSTSARLTWSGVSGASGYRIFEINGAQKTSLGSVSSSTRAVNITGLAAGSTDSFLVEAYSLKATADSAVVTVALPGALAAPQVTATSTSSTTAALSWNAVNGAQGYRIYMWNGYQAVLLGTFNSATTSVQVTNLTPGTTAQFVVEAYNSTSVADSNWVSLVLPLYSHAMRNARIRA